MSPAPTTGTPVVAPKSNAFIQSGTAIYVNHDPGAKTMGVLPPLTFNVNFNEQRGMFYLLEVEALKVPSKIYGDTMSRVDRILKTYKDRGQTGVLLNGEKGSGKTLLARCLSVKAAAEEKMPTIIVATSFHKENFFAFLQQITQPCLVLFDEFEKTYSGEEQEAMLQLFDGAYNSNKLFVLTSNERHRLDRNLLNRPGRIYYSITYRGLDKDFIDEYCKDKLNDQSMTKKVEEFCMLFKDMNFDMLAALIEEMNRFGEEPLLASKWLNLTPENDNACNYKVGISINGVQTPEDDVTDNEWSGNPWSQGRFRITYKKRKDKAPAAADGEEDDADDNFTYANAFFTRADFVSYDSAAGVLIYQNKDGETMSLTKQAENSYTAYDMFAGPHGRFHDMRRARRTSVIAPGEEEEMDAMAQARGF
jgi:DNA replication protein DnaC